MTNPATALGGYIRSRRKAKGMTLLDLATRAGYSVGYISKLESGRIPEGPPLACLERMAGALEVDVLTLVRLKEAETCAPQGNGETAEGLPMHLTPDERDLITIYRTLDQRVRLFLRSQATLCQSHFGRDGTVPLVSNALPLTSDGLPASWRDRPDITDLYVAVARTYQELGEKWYEYGYGEESMVSYKEAEAMLTQLGRKKELALVRYRIARTYHRLGSEEQRSEDERLGLLNSTALLCSLMYRELSASEDPGDEEKEYLPAVLAVWAAAITQIPKLVSTLHELPEEEERSIRGVYGHRARAKREEAERRYIDWLAVLRKRKKGRERSRKEAETHHRLGLLYLRMAQEGDRTDASKMSRDHLVKAIGIRRQLASQSSEADRDYYFRRLATSHLELGGMLYKSARSDRHEQAMWQYRVAMTLHPVYDPSNNRYVEDLVFRIEEEIGQDARVVISRRIDELIAKSDFRNLDYPIELPTTRTA
jgi:transcriptional regulator with XRE-family HTH domain/tetratricopeptide (TPR) repeat protein